MTPATLRNDEQFVVPPSGGRCVFKPRHLKAVLRTIFWGELIPSDLRNSPCGRLNDGQYKFSEKQEWSMDRKETIKTGITFGTALAITISWSANHSILWAIIHGILSWLYVIYYAFFRS